MASRRQSPTPKRTLALKRADGEPLTRADIQYDVLNAIFSEKTPAFTDPYNSSEDAPKVCFRDLYIKAIMNSSKATKALKDKMAESSDFAEDFAMLALLVNVGRINTTMSCENSPVFCLHTVPRLRYLFLV
jgi:Ino eighty subunit 1